MTTFIFARLRARTHDLKMSCTSRTNEPKHQTYEVIMEQLPFYTSRGRGFPLYQKVLHHQSVDVQNTTDRRTRCETWHASRWGLLKTSHTVCEREQPRNGRRWAPFVRLDTLWPLRRKAFSLALRGKVSTYRSRLSPTVSCNDVARSSCQCEHALDCSQQCDCSLTRARG
jgi:hypothetical protein